MAVSTVCLAVSSKSFAFCRRVKDLLRHSEPKGEESRLLVLIEILRYAQNDAFFAVVSLKMTVVLSQFLLWIWLVAKVRLPFCVG